MSESPEPIWQPDPARVAGAGITRFAGHLTQRHGVEFPGYLPLWRWSVDHLDEFWSAVWDFYQVEADGSRHRALADAAMPGARWFPGTRLNYAEHALRYGADTGRADKEPSPPSPNPVPSRAPPGRSCGPRSGRSRPGCARPASVRAIGWSATCPTPPRRSWRSSRRPASAPCGRPAGKITRARAPRTASPSWSRSCSSPPTAITGTARRTTGEPKYPRCSGHFRRCARRSTFRTWKTRPRLLRPATAARLAAARRRPHGWRPQRPVARGDRGRGRSPLRARRLRRTAVGAVLLRHHRPAEGHRAWPRRRHPRALQGAWLAPGHRPRRAAVLVHDDQLDDVEHSLPPGCSSARRWSSTTAARHSRARTGCGGSPPISGSPRSASAPGTFRPASTPGCARARSRPGRATHAGCHRLAPGRGALLWVRDAVGATRAGGVKPAAVLTW